MKNKFLAFLILGLGLGAASLLPGSQTATAASGMTAAEVIARCAEALGGLDKIQAVKTLRIGAVFPDHGERVLFNEVWRPNKSYNPQGLLAFDGKRACFLKGEDGRSEPKLIDPAELWDYDVEIAYYFPAFFEFPTEYLGSDSVDGRTVHKIRPKLPHGADLVYMIDASTWLPYKTNVRITLDGQFHETERIFSDYKNVDGILYPHGFTYPSRDRKSAIQGRIVSVEINIPLDEAHFIVPEGIK